MYNESVSVSVCTESIQDNAYSVLSGCTVYQSKVWTILCLYECTMKCTSEYIQEWVNCVCTSVWAARAKTMNVVCTVVCFCDDTLPCYDELSTMHSLLCTLIWWYMLW